MTDVKSADMPDVTKIIAMPDVTVTRRRRPPKTSPLNELVEALLTVPAAQFDLEKSGEEFLKWQRALKRAAARYDMTAVFGDCLPIVEAVNGGEFEVGTSVQVKLIEKKAGRPRVRNVLVDE